MRDLLNQAAEFLAKKRRRQAWAKVIGILACVVVFCTTYALILPAITMSKPFCGIEEHEHSDTCYEQVPTGEQKEFICPEETLGLHAHTDDCYDSDGSLICGYADFVVHTHDESCYDADNQLVCPLPEIKEHVHTEECYAFPQESELEQPEVELVDEDPGEQEDDLPELESDGETVSIVLPEADSAEQTEADDPAEPELICEQPEIALHTHTDACYTDGTLTCGKLEVKEHVHTEDCFAQETERKLVCEKEQHVHTDSCYSDPAADVEEAGDWEGTLPQDLTGVWADDLAAVAESQIGYAESTENYDVTEAGEHRGYTRYGAWYGDEYADWNSLFALFCLNYSGMPADAMPADADIPSWIEALTAAGNYADAGTDQPSVGDLAFFDTDEDGKADRVGIVTKSSHGLFGLGAAKMETVEGDIEGKVQTASYNPDEDDTIIGYAVLPENPAAREGSITQTYEGDGYTVTASYGPEAEIPENAELVASEYAKDSERYRECYTQAAALCGQDEDEDNRTRLFDIGFYVDGKEIEPAAEVTVTITCADQKESVEYSVIHFGEETEQVESSSSYEDGEQSVNFSLNRFSPIMLLAVDPSDLDGKSFALVNGANQAAMLAEANTDTTLKGQTVTVRFNAANDPYLIDAAENLSWTFEKVPGTEDGGSKYYVTAEIGGTKKYLNIAETAVTLVDDPPEDVTSEITVTQGTGQYSAQYRLANSGGYAVNLYGGNASQGFGGWKATSTDKNDYFYLAEIKQDPSEVGTVQGISPNGSVINMFDYWMTDPLPDGGDYTEGRYHTDTIKDQGINAGHALKFLVDGIFLNENKDRGINIWTTSKNPYTGMVENKLVNGYPMLTEAAAGASGTDDTTAESLAYLFDPTVENAYKKTFRNVKNLLQVNEQGYYYYDSQKNFAELDEETKKFTLYDGWGVTAGGASKIKGQFLPFNKFQQSALNNSISDEINHYFGLTLTSRFVQRYGGHTSSARNKPTVFEFSGDDDVWIFIDNVLVADLGGLHDKASIKIDFATGEVFINDEVKTTLKDAYTDAGMADSEKWAGDTFADETYHTLKFYYLERGNYDSNMSLEYNLTPIPDTGITKVNQYGEAIPGAEFSVYKATDETYETIGSDPVYTGVTDENGEMVFRDEDNMPYTIKELQEKFGQYFVLRETKVPDGYRLTNEDIYLEIVGNVIQCKNTYESGSWATPTVQVSAPSTLLLADGTTRDYYDMEQDRANGTLFAVVMKRKDKTVPLYREGAKYSDNWAPVYGNTTDGYTVVDVQNGTDLNGSPYNSDYTAAAIDAAKRVKKDGGNVVFNSSGTGAMEIIMEKLLPGDITKYYYMLKQTGQDVNAAEYTIAYYWTEADSLDEATSANTHRVNADSGEYPFDRTFGATIEVPNLANRLLVQKFGEDVDEDGAKTKTLVNGAKFALYRAFSSSTVDGPYLADDGSSVSLSNLTVGQDYTIDSGTGVITIKDGRTITPVDVQTTAYSQLAGEEGTAIFGVTKELKEGRYYVREITAPAGYTLNPSEVMVLVNEQGIYANAGTADDDVTVARGPGYVVSTLHKAASECQIDNTLTWIYQKMRASSVSTSFADMEGEDWKGWPYIKDGSSNDLTSYLEYIGDPNGNHNALSNYQVNQDRTPIEGTYTDGNRRLYTDTGWSYYEIYQDYEYGKKEAAENGANYENLAGQEIANLFSRSTYIQVTDKKLSNLEISKTVVNAPAGESKEFTFTVNLTDAQGTLLTGSYDYGIYTTDKDGERIPATDENGEKLTGTIVLEQDTDSGQDTDSEQDTENTITLKNGQIAVFKDLPGGSKYTIAETAANGYGTTVKIDDGNPASSLEATGTLRWEMDENGNLNNTSVVAYTNTYLPDLTLKKVDSIDHTKVLQGAQFVVYRLTDDGKKEYYKLTTDGKTEWTELGLLGSEKAMALTTDEGGTITLQHIPDGTYTAKEIAAPDGYTKLTSEITLIVSGGKIISAQEGTKRLTVEEPNRTTFTVENSPGVTLPNTGGKGTNLYTYGGLLLIVGAFICGYLLRRKQARA